MKNLKNRVMAWDFKRIAKQFVLIALCVVVIGGAVSGVLLQPQIREAISLEQTEKYEIMPIDPMVRQDHSHQAWQGHEHDLAWAQITEPSVPVKAAIGAIGTLCVVLGVVYWLLVAAWLYQASARADLYPLLWFLLGLAGNLAAVVLFLAVRSLRCVPCRACGRWQAAGQFCRWCGSPMTDECPACGASVRLNDRYCRICGTELPHKTGSTEEKNG